MSKQNFKREPKYKEDYPINTINKIRNILFSRLNILTFEDQFFDEFSLFHSCRIRVANNNLAPYNFATNGKGKNIEYALASGYGEFMERLQNSMLFSYQRYCKPQFLDKYKNVYQSFYSKLLKNNIVLKYDFAPDEQKSNNIIRDNYELFRQVLSNGRMSLLKNFYFDEKGKVLPFYNVKTCKTEYLPIEFIRFICGSNGMCAGNTPAEALVEGICEVFERYALRMIYKYNLTLPTIPQDYFKGTKIYEKIKDYEYKKNLNIQVKDCSCNLNLPVLGILLVDYENRKYKFHLGANPSPTVALERCLSESYQGRNSIKFKSIDTDRQIQLLTDMELKEKEFGKFVVDGTGELPISIFDETPTYDFNGFYMESSSNIKDLRVLIDLVLNNNFKLYIRDVSFLDFPSYYIYIPGMSEIKSIFSNEPFSYKPKKLNNTFLNLQNLKNASSSHIEDSLTNLHNDMIIKRSKFPNDESTLNSINPQLLLTLLNIKAKNYSKAVTELVKVTSDNNLSEKEHLMYQCMRDYLYFIINDKDPAPLYLLYDKFLVTEVGKMINEDPFLYQTLPSCFNCDECQIASSCRFFDLAKLFKKIENNYEKNVIDQNAIATTL